MRQPDEPPDEEAPAAPPPTPRRSSESEYAGETPSVSRRSISRRRGSRVEEESTRSETRARIHKMLKDKGLRWHMKLYDFVESDNVQLSLLLALAVDGIFCVADIILGSVFPSRHAIETDSICCVGRSRESCVLDHGAENASAIFERSPERERLFFALHITFSTIILSALALFELELLALIVTMRRHFWSSSLHVLDFAVVSANLVLQALVLVMGTEQGDSGHEVGPTTAAIMTTLVIFRFVRVTHAGVLSYHRIQRRRERQRELERYEKDRVLKEKRQRVVEELHATHEIGAAALKWPWRERQSQQDGSKTTYAKLLGGRGSGSKLANDRAPSCKGGDIHSQP